MRGLLLVCLLATQAVYGATIERVPGERAVFLVEGEFKPGDGDRFATAVAAHENAVIVLSSPGGHLLSGLRIGQLVRDRGFTTLVLDDSMCASACALAWIGSPKRSMQPQARIGFHAAYVVQRGQARETGAGNALVGAYLSRLGLSDKAIYALASSGPSEMGWLTPVAAASLEISVTIVQPPPRVAKRETIPGKGAPVMGGPKAPEAAGDPATPREAADKRSTEFAARYFSTWSDSNERALAAFRSYYAPLVFFYGAKAERDALLTRKQDFAERWPERVYAVREPSLEATCDGEERCVVTGLVDWEAQSSKRGARTAGLAKFELTLDVSGTRPTIVGETGVVVERR